MRALDGTGRPRLRGPSGPHKCKRALRDSCEPETCVSLCSCRTCSSTAIPCWPKPKVLSWRLYGSWSRLAGLSRSDTPPNRILVASKNFMRSTYILILLVLPVPLSLSISALDMHSAGELIDVLSTNSWRALDMHRSFKVLLDRIN